MGTVTSRAIVDAIIANDGVYPGDPPVVKIVEYETVFGGERVWGLVYAHDDPMKYQVAENCIHPRVIYERPVTPAPDAAARRPDAEPLTTTFADLRVGDYMTAEGAGGRWVEVVDLRGPSCYVKSRRQAVPDGQVSVLFEIPEPVNLRSLETRYWIDRPFDELVTVDGGVR